jgi:multidrug efflux system membrane fusion protein
MRANLRRDRALLANAHLDLQRYKELVATDSIAKQQLDTQIALVDQDESTVAADEAQVKTAELNLQYTHIVSPANGRVGLRLVDQGNYVTPGDANGIVVVTQLQPISAVFSIPEDNVIAIEQRLRSGATLTVDAYDRGGGSKLAEGKLLTLDNLIDVTTGTFKLRALFDNSGELLFPNQFVNIELLQDTLRDQIVIPVAAVQRGAPNGVVGAFVYAVDTQASTVKVKPVVLGVADGERIAVTSGLAEGDVVVTEGGDRLRDGAAVELPKASSEPTKAQQKPGGQQGNGSHHHRHSDAGQ